MKKLFALIIVALLATSVSFADTWGPTGNQSGEFTANVYCTPTINGVTLTAFLGDYFDSYSGIITESTDKLEWKLTGPSQANYTFDLTISNETTNAPILDGTVKIGNWTTPFTTPVTAPLQQILTGTEIGIDCEQEASAEISVTVATINCIGADTGAHSWSGTFTVTVTI